MAYDKSFTAHKDGFLSLVSTDSHNRTEIRDETLKLIVFDGYVTAPSIIPIIKNHTYSTDTKANTVLIYPIK